MNDMLDTLITAVLVSKLGGNVAISIDDIKALPDNGKVIYRKDDDKTIQVLLEVLSEEEAEEFEELLADPCEEDKDYDPLDD